MKNWKKLLFNQINLTIIKISNFINIIVEALEEAQGDALEEVEEAQVEALEEVEEGEWLQDKLQILLVHQRLMVCNKGLNQE